MKAIMTTGLALALFTSPGAAQTIGEKCWPQGAMQMSKVVKEGLVRCDTVWVVATGGAPPPSESSGSVRAGGFCPRPGQLERDSDGKSVKCVDREWQRVDPSGG
ncbi:hypothetical protein [Niveispirillum sp. KHB5.9]|uniref:hypothetical protein n=1 Tax=Niveispirillum sp. KHB5.9 TaxID=3400269 RepID=UPI003A8B0C14